VHGLSFGEVDLDDLAVHAAPHGHRVECRHRAKTIKINGEVAALGRCHYHRNNKRTSERSLTPTLSAPLAAGAVHGSLPFGTGFGATEIPESECRQDRHDENP
jgi:hypothetical protein